MPATDKKEKSMPNVKAKDFDVSRYSIAPFEDNEKTKDNYQFTGFPKYSYGKNGNKSRGDKMVVVTGPIKLSKGGIPKVDGKFRTSDNQCMYMWVPLMENDPGAVELYDKVLKPLDDYNTKRIVTEKNKDYLSKIDASKKETFWKNLKYLPIVKEFTPGEGDEDADDGDDGEADADDGKNKKEASESYKRFKVRIDTGKWDPKASKDAPKTVATRVYINDEKGNAKMDPEHVTTLEDMRELVTWNSTVRLVLDFSKFWVMKTVEDGVRKCSITVKLLQVYVVERSEYTKSASNVLGMSVFGDSSDGDSESNSDDDENDKADKADKAKSGKTDKADNAEKSDSDGSDAESGKSDSEKSGSDNESGSDESGSGSESESEESEKPPTPPPAKKSGKSGKDDKKSASTKKEDVKADAKADPKKTSKKK